jgi:hypothetical protein
MIHIVDDWYMDADRFCYTVGRLATRKDKKGEEQEYLKNPTYHGTVAHALRSILEDGVRDKIEKKSLTNLAEVFAEMEKYNLHLIKEFDRVERELLRKRRPGAQPTR